MVKATNLGEQVRYLTIKNNGGLTRLPVVIDHEVVQYVMNLYTTDFPKCKFCVDGRLPYDATKFLIDKLPSSAEVVLAYVETPKGDMLKKLYITVPHDSIPREFAVQNTGIIPESHMAPKSHQWFQNDTQGGYRMGVFRSK